MTDRFFDRPEFRSYASRLDRELRRYGGTLSPADARWYYANDYEVFAARDAILVKQGVES